MNAAKSMTIDQTGRVIFLSTTAGGVDLDGVYSLTIYNSGSLDASIKDSHLHPTVAAAPSGTVTAADDQRMPLPAGASVTLRRPARAGRATNQLDSVHVRCEGNGSTTIGFGVTEG